jgi:hypothetical protein
MNYRYGVGVTIAHFNPKSRTVLVIVRLNINGRIIILHAHPIFETYDVKFVTLEAFKKIKHMGFDVFYINRKSGSMYPSRPLNFSGDCHQLKPPRRQEPPLINVDREALKKAADALRETTRARRAAPKAAGGALKGFTSARKPRLRRPFSASRLLFL